MIRLCQSDSAFTIQQYYDALQAQGIGCLIRNQFISGAAGDLPIQDTHPELWLMDKDDLTMAKKVLNELSSDSDEGEWVCSSCNEPQEPAFHLCWQCQQPRNSA
ncbi:putative signal transducing protein [Marisediminitalea sp.]|uniref:putative signal transducing protein n=1 Tax=Marisediminitalea sp. TaxID=2662268 RepID=UPI00338768A4|nr:DUF2007 domain-containing protein [Aestuariibacter sp.]MCP4232759.1 DUF2007 domain-containing protein [Aestuariibacter sp.]MCP4524353.1 DUF2007 domain-containing protein [Aestuariibacter sp.]MCP4946122.1 DUF2007 domain-containing protein [Aestuariibacter sp.]MCP5010496.1 DUF2007 domain-containing protein [Aestuariibacter sp.]|tara:strand:+ start:2802 stop:3113 length:312 start_codon:yes stop_codon:yes gene_type:complete